MRLLPASLAALAGASPVLALTASPVLALTVSPVPEPSTMAMVALGAAAGLFVAWRKRRNSGR